MFCLPNIFFRFSGLRAAHLTHCVTGLHNCTCQMASKSVKWLKLEARMWQTDYRQTTVWGNVQE